MKMVLGTPRESLADNRIPTASRNVSQTRNQVQDDALDIDDLAEPLVAASAPPKKTRGRPKIAGSAAKKPVVSKGAESVPASTIRPRGRPARTRQAVTPPEEIPETQFEEPEVPEQPEAMDIDISTQDAEPTQLTVDPIESAGMYDTNDVSLRRRLGDLAKRYESLEMRHRDLREVGVKEAERNFDRLRKQAEERTAGK